MFDVKQFKMDIFANPTENAIDYLEQNYKKVYADMVKNIAAQYEAAEQYRYHMREAVRTLREHAKRVSK